MEYWEKTIEWAYLQHTRVINALLTLLFANCKQWLALGGLCYSWLETLLWFKISWPAQEN